MSESKDKTELAEERTKYAEDRNVMAMERTFAGWMRTAFAAIGIGLGFMGLAGFIAGTAGASGGLIKTPATTELMHVPMKVAAATTTSCPADGCAACDPVPRILSVK